MEEDNRYHTSWWNEWVTHQAKATRVVIPHLRDIKVKELQI